MGCCLNNTQNKYELIKKHSELCEIDLTAFEEDNIDECTLTQHTENPNQSCVAIKRITLALKYYSALNIVDNKEHRNMFVEFVNGIYHALIDDYIHLINHHSSQLQHINKKLTPCNIQQCQYTSRHHRLIIDNRNVSDSRFHFYKQTMDGLHFYLLHCYDTGLRTRNTDYCQQNYETKEENNNDPYFDATFSTINKLITDTKHITKSFERFAPNNSKFNIQINNEPKNETTCIDAIYCYLEKMKVDPVFINKLRHFVQSEQYDTDSIQFEFENKNNMNCGNITKIIENEQCVDLISEFIQAMKINSSSFSIGFRFYYWSYYESINEIPDNEQYTENINDHSGYNVCDLFIKPKYASFKDEISHYEHITLKQYTNNVIIKVKEYQQSKIAKSTRAANIYVPKHYGISDQSPLQYQHILAMVLYTDYTNLSADFSSTFRKNTVFETIDTVKKRNSVYYWFSKSLRECVEIYGQCKSSVPPLHGPFYCGMKTAMHMPSFNIRLCSPTSTSMQLEVAIKFSGHQGMVIQLNNPQTAQYSDLRSFNVSWVSQYKEEDERLFFGGFYFVKIDSVRIRSTLQNFQHFIYALYYLDTMITGGRQEDSGEFDDIDMKVNENDILIIQELINDKVSPSKKDSLKKPTRISFDSYVYLTFASFIQNKQQIILHLDELNCCNGQIRDILMHSLDSRQSKNESERGKNDFNNLFRKDMLIIFKNVQRIVIKTTCDYGIRSYSISMVALLCLIKSQPLEQIVIKAVTRKEYNWINALWLSSKDMLINEYDSNGYTISVKDTTDFNGDQQYWFIVNKN